MSVNNLKNYKPLLYNKFSWIALFFIVYSLFFTFAFESIHKLNYSYIIFALVSYFFWTALGVIFQSIPKKPAEIIIAIFSFIWSVLILTAPAFFKEFKEFLSTGLVILLKEQPVYFWGYVRQITHTFWQISAILILTAVLFQIFKIKASKHFQKSKILLVLSLLIIFLANLTLNVERRYFQRNFLPVDTHTFYAIRTGLKKHSDEKPLKHFLPSGWDKNLPANKNEKYNIVLIVFESFSKVPLPFYGFDNNYMPFMTGWIKQENNQFILFKNGMSVSGATDVSMPTIYTGIGPERNYFDLIHAPFLWDYAKKAGYQTMLINTQSQEWKHMNSFVNDKYVDTYYYPEKLGMSFINDVGTDGLSLLKRIKPEILKLKSPFFLYYNTNATHGPTQDHSPEIKDFKGITDRYGKALYITDQEVKSVVSTIKQMKEFDNTIFIFTADHGYYIAKRRSRLSSFFKETLDIPIIIRFPEKWISSHQELFRTALLNQGKRITNLDIAPTVFHLIFDQKPGDSFAFSGKSLLTPINNHRTIIALSTNDTRHWSAEGFGIYKDTVSYLFLDNSGFHYFNVANDTMQHNDLIQNIPPQQKRFFDSIIYSQKYLIDVLKRTGFLKKKE